MVEKRLRSKVYVSGLYYTMQLPYEAWTHSCNVPVVSVANAESRSLASVVFIPLIYAVAAASL